MPQHKLYVNDRITIEAWELQESFLHSTGPGGQHVNKVSTAVQLKFDLKHSPSVPPTIKSRAMKIAGRKLSKDGSILIEATKHRSQQRNRDDARMRLKEILLKACEPPPPPRRKTKPTKGSVERRLKAKSNRASIKKMRAKGWDE